MSHRLQILVSPGLDARIAKAAQRSRLSKGEWVRRVLETALNDNAQPPDALGKLAALGAPTGDIDRMLAEIDADRR